jgi:hypothetical protein
MTIKRKLACMNVSLALTVIVAHDYQAKIGLYECVAGTDGYSGRPRI